VKRALGVYTALLIAILHAPVAVMILFSFNDSKYQVKWVGFSLRWYAKLLGNREIRDALTNTLLLAVTSAAAATVLGTLAALALRRAFRGKRVFSFLVTLPLMVPDVVMAFSLLALFVSLGVTRSLFTAFLAHVTFNLSYVAVVVSARLAALDPVLEQAAQDLGATPRQAFCQVTMPQLRPALLSGALLAITLSMDDFVITYFTTGVGSATLPVKIFSMVRFQVTPEINAVSTLLLALSLVLITAAVRIGRLPPTGGGR
jgi:spermidine/putrescine transport system permease protein